MRPGLVLLAAFIAVAPPPAGMSEAQQAGLSPCRPAELEGLEARCGTIQVPENRALPKGRTLGLRVVVVPPDSGAEFPDPIVPVPGGPGAGAIAAGSAWARILKPARAHRALVLIDPRGTGQSGMLDCDFSDGPSKPESYVHDFTPPDKVRACAAQLSRVADLTQMNTEAIAADLALVLTALGYDRVNLYGASGGTRQSIVFANRYPGRVRTLSLAGVVTPPDFRLPLDYARDGQRALDLLFADCEKDQLCHAAYPDIRADFAKVLAALDRAPARVALRMTPPASPTPPTAVVTRGIFAERIRTKLYSQSGAATIPFIVHRAAAGDFSPFVEEIVPGPGGPQSDGVAMGHYLSVTCSEDLARITPADRAPAAQGTFLGDYRVQQQMDACKLWPHARMPAEHFQGRTLQIPTLVISGDADPVTPPRWGEAVKRYFPLTKHVVFPTGAHVPFGTPCGARLSNQFIMAGDARGLDDSCAATFTRPPFRLP